MFFLDQVFRIFSGENNSDLQINLAKSDGIIKKVNEKNHELEQLLEKIQNEKKDLESKLKTLNEKTKKFESDFSQERKNSRKVHDDLSREKQKSESLLEKNKKEKYEFDSKLKGLEENYQRKFNQLKDHCNELELAKKNMETNMGNNITNLEQQLRDERTKFLQNFKQTQEKYKKNINDIRQKLDEKGNGLRDLEDENAKLKEEASKYQSALGVATNIRLGDGDQNNSVKLKQDILKLQNTLENYVTHLKPNMDLNIKEIQKLAQEYGCLNEITEENPNKIFIKAILQRKALDLVRVLSHNLVKFRGDPNNYPFALESDVESKTDELLRLIKLFTATRAGTDEVTDASIIKIRQQVYGILGNRGFNNIIDDDGNTRMHDFIAYVSNELNEIMNRYRKINDLNRKEQVDAMAPKLVEEIYKLFWFRTNVQEPKTECQYFEKVKINPNLMRGTWNDDEIDNLCVDICYFPLIGRDLNSSDAKIYTLAKVFPRSINGINEVNEEKNE
ncbi:hypothetical protein RclHR1_01540008 [Rhizophagus clarus]|uniref:Uncharacterized protein n=1 Tax=Rhizophagus clarus TaxID=94130 RepID=A0A2Z6QGQ4_9GLOM|nr:hypothetical protein RclHR1_01540008 [Rhizophagus clarus]GET01983.1 hypothetical protein GLOIN_2v1547988 [Rhizophagus clarus]